jgi:hypothetical protein
MKLFQCDCGNFLYFENRVCANCSRAVAYLPHLTAMSALETEGTSWRALADGGRTHRLCVNHELDACNWVVDPDAPWDYCLACRANGLVPDLSHESNLRHWRVIEIAKRRLFYSLLRWRLPIATRREDPAHGLDFEFLADGVEPGRPRIMTGHDEGRITIALAEADDLERERRRLAMGEPYRTLLGHFRHEIAHHYWDILVRDGGKLDACRAVFGDEREDYGEAMRRHYRDKAPPDWPQRFVSAYASMHPWEDFAESWAHYFHIVDALETAGEFGVGVQPRLDTQGALRGQLDFGPYRVDRVETLVRAWLPLTIALNSINRSIGHGDVYPFVLPPSAVQKLGFIHDLIAGRV